MKDIATLRMRGFQEAPVTKPQAVLLVSLALAASLCACVYIYTKRGGVGVYAISPRWNPRQMPTIIGTQKFAESFIIGQLINNITQTTKSDFFSPSMLIEAVSPLEGGRRVDGVKQTSELMDELWENTRKIRRLFWLADLVGDSFLRGQFRVFEKYLVGNRSSPSDAVFGSFEETYHKDHILCCEHKGACFLRLSYYSFNSSIHDEIERMSNEHDTAICVSWRWSAVPEEDKDLNVHLERHLSKDVVPRVVVVNHGLHCAFRCANPYKNQSACSGPSMSSISNLLNRIYLERGSFVAVDTAPFIRENKTISSCPLMSVNQKVMQINNRMRNHFKSLRNSHIWVRDIEKWSYLFHANPLCIQSDGIHVTCNHFQEAHHNLLMNYIAGYLQLFTFDSLTYKP